MELTVITMMFLDMRVDGVRYSIIMIELQIMSDLHLEHDSDFTLQAHAPYLTCVETSGHRVRMYIAEFYWMLQRSSIKCSSLQSHECCTVRQSKRLSV
jgi:hypothetical protein